MLEKVVSKGSQHMKTICIVLIGPIPFFTAVNHF